jgi:hypothetical protein
MRRSGSPPRSLPGHLEEHRLAAENRYRRYMSETKALLTDADRSRDEGKWSDVAAFLQAASATISAAQGCARELNLIYLLNGE